MAKVRKFYCCATTWNYEFLHTRVTLQKTLKHFKEVNKCWPGCGIMEIKLSSRVIKKANPKKRYEERF